MNYEINKTTTDSPASPDPSIEASLQSIKESPSSQPGNGHVEHDTPFGITVNKNANSRTLKSIMPKTAFEVLKELKDVFIDNYTSIGSPKEGYTVSINMNNKEFEAKGRSKKDTENLVYELALRDFITSKLNDADKAQEVKDEAKLHILPFALHKLFNQWEQDGYLVPITQFSTDLPVDWQTMSPVTLLTLMRKEARFVECDFSSGQGSVKPRVIIFVDNQEFTTCGRTKSIARYNAAVMACNALFKTNFTADMEDENCVSPSVLTSTASLDTINMEVEHWVSPIVETSTGSLDSNDLEDDNFVSPTAETSLTFHDSINLDVTSASLPVENLLPFPDDKLAVRNLPKKNPVVKPKDRTKLPKNWKNLHSNNVLQMMRPNTKLIHHISTDTTGVKAHLVITSVDGQKFAATAQTKKLATKKLTIEVCNKLFKTDFKFDIEGKL